LRLCWEENTVPQWSAVGSVLDIEFITQSTNADEIFADNLLVDRLRIGGIDKILDNQTNMNGYALHLRLDARAEDPCTAPLTRSPHLGVGNPGPAMMISCAARRYATRKIAIRLTRGGNIATARAGGETAPSRQFSTELNLDIRKEIRELTC